MSSFEGLQYYCEVAIIMEVLIYFIASDWIIFIVNSNSPY